MDDANQPIRAKRTELAGALCAAILSLSAMAPSRAAELSSGIMQLYTSVSIYPPSASTMTVCYGFVCRRREMLDFGAADRAALARIMATGRANAAAERAAVQKAVIWFDRRMGPILGTDKRVAKADFRANDDKHNYDCWDTTTSEIPTTADFRWGKRRITPRFCSSTQPRWNGPSISGPAAICNRLTS